MSKSQHKKKLARLFNLLRAEKLAYEMDRVLYPVPSVASNERMKVRAGRISKSALFAGIALSVSLGDL